MDWLDLNEKRTPEQINETPAQDGALMGTLHPSAFAVKCGLITGKSTKAGPTTAHVQPRDTHGGEQ